MWQFEFPNLPTFIVNILLFIVSIVLLVSAIHNQNMVLGIVALVIAKIDIKADYKRRG